MLVRTAEEASLTRKPAALRVQALLFVVLLAVLPGCVQQPREAPTCEDTSEFACFRGAFRTLVGDPVPDLELCPRDLPDVPCATTNAEGQWQIPGLPRDSNLAVFAEHPEYTPTLFPQASAMDWYAWFKVAVPPFVLNTHANRLDVELDPERGHLLFLTWEGLNIDGVDTPNVPDVTAELIDTDGSIFYGDGLGLATTTESATTGSGAGGALNLAPGTARVRLQGPGGVCGESMFHWAPEADGVIPVPIEPGFVTAIDVMCPTP